MQQNLSGFVIVKYKDSLSKIAREILGDEGRWDEIYNLNKCTIGPDPSLIKIGQKLILPNDGQPQKRTTQSFVEFVIVKHKDSLSKIAKEFLGDEQRWDEIYNLNKGTIGPDPNLLKIGQKVMLPKGASSCKLKPLERSKDCEKAYKVGTIGTLGNRDNGQAKVQEYNDNGIRVARKNYHENISNEIRGLLMCQHPNIINILSASPDRRTFMMELADGGTLLALREQRQRAKVPFTEEEISSLLEQTCEGIQHAHERLVLHRDVKIDNIFLTSKGEVKIGDFGLCVILRTSEEKIREQVGNIHLRAPEMDRGEPYSFPIDIYNIGLVMYEITTFESCVRYKYDKKPIPDRYSTSLRSIINGLLQDDPLKRIKLSSVLKQLKEAKERKHELDDFELVDL